jgi:hypothetical protein
LRKSCESVAVLVLHFLAWYTTIEADKTIMSAAKKTDIKLRRRGTCEAPRGRVSFRHSWYSVGPHPR